MMVLTRTELCDLFVDNVAMFEVDLESGKINWASRVLEVMFGYAVPGDLEGRPIEALVPDEVGDLHRSVHRPAFAAAPSARLISQRTRPRGRRRDGSTFPVEVMLLPKAVNLNRVVVGIVFDLSDRAGAS